MVPLLVLGPARCALLAGTAAGAHLEWKGHTRAALLRQSPSSGSEKKKLSEKKSLLSFSGGLF